MIKFGIEIRKAGRTDNLFRDVDMVLRNAGIPSKGVSKETQRATVAHALHRMIKPNHWLDVCCIRDCVDVCQVCVSSERMAIYRASHCIHWNDMDPDFRTTLIAMVLDDFREVLEGVS